VRLLRIPGVFVPLSDTRLLAECLRRELRPGDAVADICTGSGALAVVAALAGARRVSAIDVSRRAVLATSLNARLNGVSVRALRGDLFGPLGDERLDLIVSNPPYVPAPAGGTPARGPARAWDAGRDGRMLLDRICTRASRHLAPGGRLLVVHSHVCDTQLTLDQLTVSGLDADVLSSRIGPLGPLLAQRAQWLQDEGRLGPGACEEQLVVVRAQRPSVQDDHAGTPDGRPPASACR
jgi:release factor glutamine methyltransferase